jgi:outer membrane protein insertion porin family
VKKPPLDDEPPGSAALTPPILNSTGGRQCISQDGNSTIVNKSGSSCAAGFQDYTQNIAAFKEVYYGNSWKPRVSVGFGVSWNSPFGPLRIDIAKALVKQPGDDTKLFTFNVGTQF